MLSPTNRRILHIISVSLAVLAVATGLFMRTESAAIDLTADETLPIIEMVVEQDSTAIYIPDLIDANPD
jgi:hypothetical protein